MRTVDEAIRRRIQLVPFLVTIPEGERDKDLLDKLKPERPGILQWAIDGCLEWQKSGLAPPTSVTEATAKYLSDEDNVARWIEDECVTAKTQWGSAAQLWGRWKTWCDDNNEAPGSQKSFAQEMEKRGYMRSRSQQIRGFSGIDIKPSLKPQTPPSYD